MDKFLFQRPDIQEFINNYNIQRDQGLKEKVLLMQFFQALGLTDYEQTFEIVQQHNKHKQEWQELESYKLKNLRLQWFFINLCPYQYKMYFPSEPWLYYNNKTENNRKYSVNNNKMD